MDFKGSEAFILSKLKTELPANLYYHSYNHVMDVLQAATQYAQMEAVSEYDQVLLKTAVLFHDSGFTIQSKDHEELGCGIVKEFLPNFGYTPEEIEKICGMIMATKIPQTPNNLLEQIICDADLDYLGRDDFWEIGYNLYKELEIYGILTDEKDWNRLQLKFLTKHQFFTNSAKALRKEKKDSHTQKIQDIVETYT
ncbi:MAG: phosphohydrolase [Bacteroidetes bacterium B1(2017)]|nr:MAG: phosphohydrolase [Bacteroidetes bacterium B1(2017)]